MPLRQELSESPKHEACLVALIHRSYDQDCIAFWIVGPELLRLALEIAREQATKSYELRAATRLGRLLRDQGRSQEAREVLAPVYDWFTEGFDTKDLKDAGALLDEL